MGRNRPHVPPPSVHDDATLTKDELERVKLALEIAELRRPWWQKSAYLINALIGLCSVSILFITGSFQANSLRNENDRFVLDQRTKEFESKSGFLYQEMDRLKKEKNDLAALEAKNRYVTLVVAKTNPVDRKPKPLSSSHLESIFASLKPRPSQSIEKFQRELARINTILPTKTDKLFEAKSQSLRLSGY